MNIYTPSQSKIECAQALDDILLNIQINDAYKILTSSERTHSAIRWARSDLANFEWLQSYLGLLLLEWEYRHDLRKHPVHFELYKIITPEIEKVLYTPYNGTPYMGMNVYDAYKRMLSEEWARHAHELRWTHRQRPNWSSSKAS